MALRFGSVLVPLCVLLAVFAGVAQALDFDDEDPEPPHGEVGQLYEYEIGTHAGCLPHRLEIGSGQLPPGLSIRKVSEGGDRTTFVVEGTPTESGTFSAWIHLRDCENKSAETLFMFDIWPSTFVIATSTLKPAVTGSLYTAKLEVSGRASTTTWEVRSGSLPAGLTLSRDGVISGIATAAGSSTFSVEATGVALDFSGTRSATHQYTLQVLAPLAVTASRTTGEVRTRFTGTLVAHGGQAPYTWTATGLPGGLTLGADGAFSGRPARAGTYLVSAQVTDATGAGKTMQLRLVVRPHLAIATRRLPEAGVGHVYRVTLTARGGVEGQRWLVRGLPRGLRLQAATGVIAGVPRAAGTVRLKVAVRDALGATSAKTLTLAVR
jgi:Putative Ig domain